MPLNTPSTPLGPFRRLLATGCAVIVSLLANAPPTQAQARAPRTTADLTSLDLEQLLQLEVVFAASKRNQNPREIASVVSVVTAGEILKNGYRTLADILRTLPSFYVTYDRNYSYVGVRGFAQPGDYSSRVLLLVDGLRINDNIYDMAVVGEEFVLDVGLIDRVEVVRGPSSAIYGSSAFFAVINVVTKRGADIGGAEVSAGAGSLGLRSGRLTYGKAIGQQGDVLISASAMRSSGAARLYFPEFDDPATNGGVAEKLDGESSMKLFGKFSRGPFALSFAHSSRDKDVPTGSYGTIFNDPRVNTVDRTTQGSVTFERSSPRGSLFARLHASGYHYHANYAFDTAQPANYDALDGKVAGLDIDARRTLFGRHLLTGGLEYRNNFQQDQINYDPDPFVSYIDSRYQSQRLGLFAQDEIRFSDRVILYAGLRQDWYETFGSATTPRLGLVLNPDSATTVKLLAGKAFRAPNEYELHYGADRTYKINPNLGPERIQTMEIAAERRLGTHLRATGSLFRNKIEGLIALDRDPADDLLYFLNRGAVHSRGVETGLAWSGVRGFAGEASMAWQHTADAATNATLTNSPHRTAKLKMFGPLLGDRLSAGLDVQHVGARKTLSGGEARPFTVTNFTLFARDLRPPVALSASAYNLFNVTYAYPGSEEHVQDKIVQDGRTFRLTATFRY